MLSNRWSVYHTSLGVISRMNEMYFIQIHGRSEDPGRVRKLVHHLLVLAAARSPYGVCVCWIVSQGADGYDKAKGVYHSLNCDLVLNGCRVIDVYNGGASVH